MIAEKPHHGYELIKAIEERMCGAYTPSPGVIYPTLAWLDDMSYAAIDIEEAGRKRYRITPEGEAFLVANRASADELLARTAPGPEAVPMPIRRAMKGFKHAMRHRLGQAPLEPDAAKAIAAALDAATETVEHS